MKKIPANRRGKNNVNFKRKTYLACCKLVLTGLKTAKKNKVPKKKNI